MPTRTASTALFSEVVRLQRLIHRLKQQPLDDGPADRSAHVLLFTVHRLGPQRLSDLAASVYLDASVVSRQVAELVADGLLARGPHPQDGRASVLSLTDAGHTFVAEMTARRETFFATVVSDWDPAELDTFTHLLRRFVDDTQATYDSAATQACAARKQPTA